MQDTHVETPIIIISPSKKSLLFLSMVTDVGEAAVPTAVAIATAAAAAPAMSSSLTHQDEMFD
jgi:hypothetical protein